MGSPCGGVSWTSYWRSLSALIRLSGGLVETTSTRGGPMTETAVSAPGLTATSGESTSIRALSR